MQVLWRTARLLPLSAGRAPLAVSAAAPSKGGWHPPDLLEELVQLKYSRSSGWAPHPPATPPPSVRPPDRQPWGSEREQGVHKGMLAPPFGGATLTRRTPGGIAAGHQRRGSGLAAGARPRCASRIGHPDQRRDAPGVQSAAQVAEEEHGGGRAVDLLAPVACRLPLAHSRTRCTSSAASSSMQ